MNKNFKNYAFIDSQNLNLGIQSMGWKLDWKKLRIYLKEKTPPKVGFCILAYYITIEVEPQ